MEKVLWLSPYFLSEFLLRERDFCQKIQVGFKMPRVIYRMHKNKLNKGNRIMKYEMALKRTEKIAEQYV